MTRPERRSSRPSPRNWAEVDLKPPSSSAGEPEIIKASLSVVERHHVNPAEQRGPADHEQRLASLEQRLESVRRRIEQRVGRLAQQVKRLRLDVDGLALGQAQRPRRPAR
ncbi:hypothetical protein [Sorangium cellulosum]|uniref:Uncharacterized protein n=1 Tax=Sorangium cellulosum So0157-2 TaxID=1254432 RepID=S4XZY1_SORCE|nr:hypothetical protein [Sorangium cellulosum]AGP38029.1 hypothetical protein SCE1572_28280 [Sorangium cellulosum So0157-2]